MRYKAKLYKSYKRRLTNGGYTFFNTYHKPSSFLMKRMKNNNKKRSLKFYVN